MKFLRWLKNLFKSKPVKVNPIVEKPVEIGENPPPSVINYGKPSNPDYNYLWSTVQIDYNRLDELAKFKELAIKNAKSYMIVSKKISGTTELWKLIAALFHRECSQDFTRCLHNGDPWNKKTVNDPAGRGPFPDWISSAVDAMLYEKAKWPSVWHILTMLEFAEKFNGLGYRRKGSEYSPYVWAATNHHDETGKYYGDRKYSETAVEKQLGVAAMMKILEDVELEIDISDVKSEVSEPNYMINKETPWFSLAEKFLGVNESDTDDRKTIAEFHKAAGASDDYRVPWCASFVTYCLKNTGFKSTGGQWARAYLDIGDELGEPEKHCIMIFERNGMGGDSHVTFWTGKQDLFFYYCLGGNQGDSVSISKYAKAKLLGCRWPEKAI